MSESKSFSPSVGSATVTTTIRATSSSNHHISTVKTTTRLAASSSIKEDTAGTMPPKPKGMVESEYAPNELKEALQSMLKDSQDPDYDARHIFGHGEADHELSMLQIITATRILDYQRIMVRSIPLRCFGVFVFAVVRG